MNYKDLKEQARLLHIEDDDVYGQRLATLPQNIPMTMIPRMSHVAEIETQAFNVQHERIAAIRERRKRETLRWMQQNTQRYVPAIAEETARPAIADEKPLPIFLKEHMTLLRHIQEHQQMGITEHYVALAWKRTNGDRVKKELEAEGLITVTGSIPTKGRYKIVYGLTEKGEEFLRDGKH
jgi:predicted transcriptional regulator